MVDGSCSATSLLGLDGFVVRAQVLTDGEWWLSVETAAALGCPDCGVRATGHGRPSVQVRDLPIGGVPVRLVWAKRRGKCLDPDCERNTFTEQSPLIEGCLTRRAQAEICRRVGEDGRTVAELAREFGVGWWTAMAAVRDHGTPLVEDPGRMAGVRFLGVDEHKMLSATRNRRTFYATSIVDIGHGRLLDVIPGRNADDVAYWCALAPGAWRQRIDAVAIDPHRGYLRGLLAYLPDTTVTVDCFHGVKLANTVVDDVRRRVQQETLGHRGHKVDPLYATRRLMTRGWERMTDKQRTKLFAALAAGDPDGECGVAVLGKELVREMYAARNLTPARWKLVAFYQHAAESEVPELTRLAKTISAWETEILNYHVTGISNGPTEAQNLITEKIRRTAHGFRNFQNYRLRLLLHSGVEWNTQPTARIRGRNPRLVA